jgi:peptidoglycan L-alanyl-D-glutamate endopeptidase CwlK
VDVVPLVNGKPDWDGSHPVWARIGELGKEAGLEWAGEWKSFRELAHFQYTGGHTLAQLKTGATIA